MTQIPDKPFVVSTTFLNLEYIVRSAPQSLYKITRGEHRRNYLSVDYDIMGFMQWFRMKKKSFKDVINYVKEYVGNREVEDVLLDMADIYALKYRKEMFDR